MVAAARSQPTRREATREGILAAAIRCFARDGYRRTSMDRVAREAGISRAALYLHFDTKESLFRALVSGLHAEGLAAARAAASGPGTLAARLDAFFEARSVRLFELLHGSAHAEEFLDRNHRLCGDVSTAAAADATRLLVRLLAAANRRGELSLAPAGLSANTAAELLLDTADGIKTRAHATLTTGGYRRRLRRAIRVLIGGMRVVGRR